MAIKKYNKHKDKLIMSMNLAMLILTTLCGCSKEQSLKQYKEIVIPLMFIQDEKDSSIEECIEQYKESEGYIDSSYTPGDSVVKFTVTDEQYKSHKKYVDSFAEVVINKLMWEMVNGEDRVKSFTSITHNETITEFTVNIDGSKYVGHDSFYMIPLFQAGALYQGLKGVNIDDVDITITMVNNENNDVISRLTYEDCLDVFEAETETDKLRILQRIRSK